MFQDSFLGQTNSSPLFSLYHSLKKKNFPPPMIGAPAFAILTAHSPGVFPSPSPWGPAKCNCYHCLNVFITILQIQCGSEIQFLQIQCGSEIQILQIQYSILTNAHCGCDGLVVSQSEIYCPFHFADVVEVLQSAFVIIHRRKV